jgi:prepilin-type N-terminal cleavage/methylation domain-containing protein/prepilin-type processing-associated H-X9-DG protein
MSMNRPSRRTGLTLPELLIVLAIVGALLLLILLALPARRETARLVGCQRNLGQIGLAVRLYAVTFDDDLPPIEPLSSGGPGPLALLLQVVDEADFTTLRPDITPRAAQDLAPIVERRVQGFICPSSVGEVPADFTAPVSYRANAGSSTAGGDGPFAPGRRTSRLAIDAADGLAYTAAFSERLLGNGRPVESPDTYALVTGPIGASGCGEPAPSAWRGDAGASWARADWVSTLYNHARPPGAAPSCVAADGATALMGTSSGHAGRVHVLMLDGSVKSYRTQVAPAIWHALGSTKSSTED